jgi:transcription antitermination factor NusG
VSSGWQLREPSTAPILADQKTSGEASQWYAIHTRARHEKAVANRLEGQNFQTFLPVVNEVHRWSDRRKMVELPLFSCYVFARLRASVEERITILRFQGVIGFVGAGWEGTPIPESQIGAVRTLLDQQLPYCTHPFIKVGQRIRIRSGALNGVEGTLIARNGDRTLVVSVDAIQRSMAVRIDGYDFEPA